MIGASNMKTEITFDISDLKSLIRKSLIDTFGKSLDLNEIKFHGLPHSGIKVVVEQEKKSGPVERPF
jgi:hypothetical protein